MKSPKLVDMGSEFWTINNNNMPVMTTTTHIHKSDQDSAKLSVNENIKKVRRTTYSREVNGIRISWKKRA